MKRALASLIASMLLVVTLALPAAAAADLSDPDALLPVDIILNQEALEIRKVYDLSPTTDPSTLPREAFDRDGYHYERSDILREVVIGAESQKVTQTETVESDNKDMETILGLLPQEKVVTTEDGFEGTLYLKVDSIQTEPSGYGSKTSPISVTRNYPNLASADTSHLPKTITEGGKTLTLQNVQWQTDNTYNANDYEIGDRFTAICTYSGSKTVSYVKGYTTTADYTGEVYRTGVTVIRYTVIFTGTPITPVEPEPEPDPDPNTDTAQEDLDIPGALILIPVALIALGAGVGGTYFVMKRKEHITHEETIDDSYDGTDAHDGAGGDTGSGHVV